MLLLHLLCFLHWQADSLPLVRELILRWVDKESGALEEEKGVQGPRGGEILSSGDHKSDTVHHKLSSWGLVRDLQDKEGTLRALACLLSQYTCFLLHFTNSLVHLCE